MNSAITIGSAVKSIARFWSILSIAMILLFLFGEGLNLSGFTAKEWVSFLFFPAGLSAGLVIAWRKEISGGTFSIISVVLFAIIMNANWFIIALAFPAVLFLLHGLFTKGRD